MRKHRALQLIGTAIIGAALLATPGCRGKKTELLPEQTSSEEALYKMGEESIKKDPEKGRLFLRQVIESFPKGFYAQRAKLAIADSYFERGDEANLILAAAEYREFISLFPYSPSAPYAQYRIAMTFYSKILKPGRDQTKTTQALAEFKRVLAAYPMSDEARQAEEKIKDCENRLAEHSLTIAVHYNNVWAFSAAISRLNEILENYPTFPGMDAVFYYLGDSYMRWGKTDQCRAYFIKVVSDYPKSKFVKKAQNSLKALDAAKTTPTK
ncbi:MAG: outer membrane protein assembly factor BamD [Candidatus Aminicenantes bacterium]|nr:outer membrane protein assembly factor BamD [Candidatus Aminicenantes bacterium]